MQIKNVRFIIAAITTFSAFAVYVSRVNLSIAIIAMVEDVHRNATGAQNQAALDQVSAATTLSAVGLASSPANGSDLEPASAPRLANGSNLLLAPEEGHQNLHRQPLSTIFPTSKNALNATLISKQKFNWSQTEQGHIMGAFFYGYILFQVLGARMAESMGAKWIVMAATAGSALISLIFPLSTQLDSIHLLMVLRFAMGLCQSAFFPAAYVLFCRWLPENERSLLLPVMFIGSNMGSISTYTMSSYLVGSPYGWPSVFYVSGLICALVSTLWLIFGSSGPDDNWLISREERNYIKGNVLNQSSESNSVEKFVVGGETPGGEQASGKEPIRVLVGSNHSKGLVVDAKGGRQVLNGRPDKKEEKEEEAERRAEMSWAKLSRSLPVWILILSMYGNEWSMVVLCYELPTYLNMALSLPLEQNGVLNSFFQFSYTLASPLISMLGTWMLERHLWSMRKIHVRRLFQSLATFGQMVCFASVPICGPNKGLIVTLMFSAIVFKACSNAGDLMVSGDLSPEYAGTIFAFANSIGNTAGFLAPELVGLLVRDPRDRVQWTPFWLTTAAIMGSSGLIFLLFGQTKLQDLSKGPVEVELAAISRKSQTARPESR